MSDTSTASAPSPAGGLFDLYAKLRTQGLSDEDAALAIAKQQRASAESRSGWRRVADIMNGTNTSDAYRQQLLQQADKPLADLAERRKAGAFAGEELGRQTGAIGSDIALQQQRGLLDPTHPANKVLQGLIAQTVPGLDPNAVSKLTVNHLPMLKDLVSQRLSEITPTIQPAPVAALTNAQTEAERAKTKSVLPADVAAKKAETARTEAQTNEINMNTTGQVAPGWIVKGDQGVKQADRDVIKNQVAAVDKSGKLIDQISSILNGDDTVMPFSTKAAKIAPLMTQLTLASKEGAGIRGLPAQDVAFLQNASGDLSAGKVTNWLGLNHNPARLNQLKQILGQNLESDANARGIVRAPAANAPEAGGPIAKAKGMLQKGETLAADPKGGLHALAPGEPLPKGWKAIP